MSAKLAMFLAQGQAGVRPQDVFATTAYSGTGASRTITNGINLSGEGGLVWTKQRNTDGWNTLNDTLRGATSYLSSNSTGAAGTASAGITAFGSTGYTIGGADSWYNGGGASTYVSWTFRRAPKFFDVVTWTGNGSNPRTISHSLGVAPGMIIIKATNQVNDWYTFHRSTGATQSLSLNSSAIPETGTSIWGSTLPGASSFTVGNSNSNGNGITYVAYLFAHDTDSSGIVQCGVAAFAETVNLGWRPQYLLFKEHTTSNTWYITDSARNFPTSSAPNDVLFPNQSSAESSAANGLYRTSTGFFHGFGFGNPIIYLAIREPT